MKNPLDKSFLKALEEAAHGRISLKESDLPKRGSAAWKSLSSRQKLQLKAARANRRDELLAGRQAKDAEALQRWNDTLWSIAAGRVVFRALPNADYQPPTSISDAKGTVEIVAGNRLAYLTIVPKVHAARGVHWRMKELLAESFYDSLDSARAKTQKPLRAMAGGTIYSFLPDDSGV
jgi:hypothetical protein